jgi:hypothetical protein
MKKTAMQEMLEWTRKTFPMDLDTPRLIESKIESLFEIEKKQIMNAYLIGFLVSKDLDMAEPSSFIVEDYYKQAHKQNK